MKMSEIKIDYSRDELFDELGRKRLKESYMTDKENSPQERFAFVSQQFSSNTEHAQRLYDYSSKHWLSYSTPILSYGRSKKGLPISCFTGETLVETIEGMKEIKDIKIGDLVLSHDETYNKVEATREQTSEDIFLLTFEEEDFRVTGNHLVLTKEDGWVRVDELDSSRHTILKIGDHLSL
jgi:hypothetical protein